MARLSDIIRSGETALQREQREQQEKASRDADRDTGSDADTSRQSDEGQAGLFQFIPRAREAPRQKLRDFPILSQIYNEVGTVATVVDQINQISAFIQALATGETLKSPPAHRPARPEPSPREKAPGEDAGPAAPEPPPRQSAAPEQAPPPPEQPPPRTQAPQPSPPEAPAAVSEEEIEAYYNQLYTFIEEIMQAAQEKHPFSVDRTFAPIARIVDIPKATDILYRKAIYTRETGDSYGFASAVVLHSVNVAIYALKIGEGLGYNRAQLIDLGVAALLHDVGMVSLPPDIFSKGRLEQADIERLHQHPHHGREILSQLGEKFGWLAEIALQEHERDDGSGYPQGLKGNQIHEYARIIGVADTYAGLTRSRPERRGLLPFEAVKEIIQNHKQKFDPKVVRVLLSKLSAFPIGSLVKLNSGAIGRVVETEETYPLRPAIRILYDSQGRHVDEDRVIQLREYPILHVTDAIYEEDLQ